MKIQKYSELPYFIVIEHIPNFFEGFTSREAKCYNINELLCIDFVKEFKEYYKDFYRFSLSPYSYDNRYEYNNYLLMGELRKGYKWHVIANLYSNPLNFKKLALPIWKAKYTKAQIRKQKDKEKKIKESINSLKKGVDYFSQRVIV